MSYVVILQSWLIKVINLCDYTLLHGCFSRFLNCTNSTKQRKASQITNIEILLFIVALIFELLTRKVLFIHRKDSIKLFISRLILKEIANFTDKLP